MRTLRKYITSIHYKNKKFEQTSNLYINNKPTYLSRSGASIWPEYGCINFHTFVGLLRTTIYKLPNACVEYTERGTTSSSQHNFREICCNQSRFLSTIVYHSPNELMPFYFSG
jgi:hypothetical protein